MALSDEYDVLTFDCYGTLVDWETGILDALRSILAAHGMTAGDEELLGAYARHEAALERGPYRRYADVLAGSLLALAGELSFEPTAPEVEAFSRSVAAWPAFPDSRDALSRLKRGFKLAVITNCDDDLFAASSRRLGVDFDWVVTAEQAGSYKPDLRSFELAFEVIGAPRERILHVAQSLFHDHVPAKRLGMTTVWIDRRHGRAGFGATLPADAEPDHVYPDLASFADAAS